VRPVQFEDVQLVEMWCDDDPSIRSRSCYVSYWQTGSRSSASVLFELDPGKSFGRHRHTAEETIVVMEGNVEVIVGDERRRLSAGALVVAPALTRHDIANVGDTVARCVGVWSSSSVVSLWDKVLQPNNSRRAGTPVPEGI
jgi:mannose-6-phosphate isomerase-like protein (cupin superfamily)